MKSLAMNACTADGLRLFLGELGGLVLLLLGALVALGMLISLYRSQPIHKPILVVPPLAALTLSCSTLLWWMLR